MPNNKPGSRLIKAAGAVVWRPGPDGEPEVLLVHRKKYNDWSLPKGKAEPGELLPVTAAREVLEEGGARLALGRRLASVRYNVGGRPKRVHYWAARALSVDERAVPNSEVDEVTWLPVGSAIDKVSYSHDHGVLADFAARPARTVPVILLRHAKAQSKSGWKRSDAVRPLDDSGRSEAKAVTDLVACFAPRLRLISSPAVRCMDTLSPLSELTGEPVRAEPALYLDKGPSPAGVTDPSADLAALLREVIAAGEPTVLCAHRENLPLVQEAALAALTGHSPDGSGDGVPGDAIAQLPKEWDETLPTSGFWVLNVAVLPPAGEGAHPGLAGAVAPPVPSGLASAPRRWWRRVFGGATGAQHPSRHGGANDMPAGHRPGGANGVGDETDREVPVAKPGDGDPRIGGADPVGVLVSADRYDLSEP